MGLFTGNYDQIIEALERTLRDEIKRLGWQITGLQNDHSSLLPRLAKLEHRFKVMDAYTEERIKLLKSYGFPIGDINPDDKRLKQLLDDYLEMRAQLHTRGGQ